MVGGGCHISACEDEAPWIQIGDHSGVDGVLEAMQFFRERTGTVDLSASVDAGVSDTAIDQSVVFGPGEISGGAISQSLEYVGGSTGAVTLHHEIAAVGVA